MKFTKILKIAKGWSSYVWLVKNSHGKEFVLKEVREKSPRKDLANREGKMLLLANSIGVGPRVEEVNYTENYVVMEYVKGPKLFDWILSEQFKEEITVAQLYDFIKELYRQLDALESIHLSHNQLQIGKNILVRRTVNTKTHEAQYVPVIIDFEKATIKENNHTKNIGQINAMLFFNPNGALAQKVREKLNLTL
jgi:putative serine/threonine protein kinase